MSNAAAPATDDRIERPAVACGDHTGRKRAQGAARGLPRAEAIAAASKNCVARGRVPRTRRALSHDLFVLFRTGRVRRPQIWRSVGLLRRFIRNDLATLHRDGVEGCAVIGRA